MEKYGKRQQLISKFIEKNSQINLSALREPEDIYIKHILDSLKLNEFFSLGKKNIVDIGTGSGFPLIPLALTNSECNFTGIESIRKKVDAVNEILTDLSISNAKVIWTRAEDHKQQYDILTARAVGYFDKLMEFGYHLVKKGGYFLLYKMNSQEELKDIINISKKYNLTLENKIEYSLFEGDIQRIIYIIKKN